MSLTQSNIITQSKGVTNTTQGINRGGTTGGNFASVGGGAPGAFYDEEFEQDFQRFQSNVGILGNSSGQGNVQQVTSGGRTEDGGPFSGDKNGSSLAVADEFNGNIQMLDGDEMSSQGKQKGHGRDKVLSGRSKKSANSSKKAPKSQGQSSARVDSNSHERKQKFIQKSNGYSTISHKSGRSGRDNMVGLQRYNSAHIESKASGQVQADVEEKMAGNQNLKMKKPMEIIDSRKIDDQPIISLQEISGNIKRERMSHKKV